jgi:hypothetical protein
LWRRVFSIGEKIRGNLNVFHQFEEILPRIWPPGQNNIAGRWITPYVYLRALKSVFGRQTNSLAAAIAKEFGGLGHGIYYDLYHTGASSGQDTIG